MPLNLINLSQVRDTLRDIIPQKENLYHVLSGNAKKVTGKYVLTVKGQPASNPAIVSDGYNPISHWAALEPLLVAFEAYDVNGYNVNLYDEGHAVSVVGYGDIVTVDGQDYMQRLHFTHKLDGKSGIKIQLGALRLRCRNGMLAGSVPYTSVKHDRQALGHIIDYSNTAADVMANFYPWLNKVERLKDIQKTVITLEDIAKVYQGSQQHTQQGERMAWFDGLKDSVQYIKANTLLDIYNGHTRYITHYMAGSDALKAKRLQSLDALLLSV